MKAGISTVVLAGFLIGSVPFTCAQGQIYFINAAPMWAPVTFADGTPIPASAGFSAQLYGGEVGSSMDALVPLPPVNHFRSDAAGFVLPGITATFPGMPVGSFVEIQMRAFSGKDWESSPIRGESNLIELRLGGDTIAPPPPLGLQSFAVYPVPEPSSLAIGLAGGVLFLGLWRMR